MRRRASAVEGGRRRTAASLEDKLVLHLVVLHHHLVAHRARLVEDRHRVELRAAVGRVDGRLAVVERERLAAEHLVVARAHARARVARTGLVGGGRLRHREGTAGGGRRERAAELAELLLAVGDREREGVDLDGARALGGGGEHRLRDERRHAAGALLLRGPARERGERRETRGRWAARCAMGSMGAAGARAQAGDADAVGVALVDRRARDAGAQVELRARLLDAVACGRGELR